MTGALEKWEVILREKADGYAEHVVTVHAQSRGNAVAAAKRKRSRELGRDVVWCGFAPAWQPDEDPILDEDFYPSEAEQADALREFNHHMRDAA